jgi:hypothetical protein
MPPLFGNKEEKAAKDAAAQVVVERLTALSASELAAEILPVFGSAGVYSGGLKRDWSEQFADDTAKSLMADSPAGSAESRSLGQLRTPIMEAIQTLENTGLLLRTFVRAQPWNQTLQITRLGQTALDEGSVHSYLRDPARG